MTGLLEHISRWLGSHEREFVNLPTVTVPSAAVSDDDTEAWGDMRYMREIVDDLVAMAHVTAATVVCPLVASMLEQPGMDPPVWRDEVADELAAWARRNSDQRNRIDWWCNEQRYAAELAGAVA